MKILFVAPRFHTNQYPTSKGLIDHGHEVHYLVQFVGVSEDYSFIHPVQMKLSRRGKRIKDRIEAENDAPTAETLMLDKFIPSFRFMYKYIKDLKPDVVIVRDRIPSSLTATIICKLLRIKKVILYNQTELYTNRTKKVPLKRRLVYAIMPRVRYTICKIRDYYELKDHKEDLYVKPHEYFIPYVCPLNPNAEGRSYFGEDGTLRLLCVGKYRPYKNQQVLIEALSLLKQRGKLNKITLTLLGQAKADVEFEYMEKIKTMVEERGLSDIVTFRGHIPYSEMGNLYQAHDVFILPSLKELASISIVESMSNAVVPISTSFNGTVTYINEGENGLIFRTNDPESLAAHIEYLSENHDAVERMGRTGYEFVKQNCMFDNYIGGLRELMKNEFDFDLE